jgi:hypothetical protein
MWTREHGGVVYVRASDGMHDRHLIVDQRNVYSSSGSFKDGPKNAATVLNEQRDIGPALMAHYENLWANARVLR